MNLTEQFQVLADEWADHCKKTWYSSSMTKYLDHPAYRKLVDLGRAIVPLVIERYRTDSLPWGFLLQEVTGVVMIPDPNRFSPAEIKHRWLQWWDQQHNGTTSGSRSPGTITADSTDASARS